MGKYHLTEKADLGVIYDADRSRYSAEEWKKFPSIATREFFITFCRTKEYPTLGFSYDEKPIGGIIFDGQTVHLAVLPEHYGKWGVLWIKALRWILAQKDPIEIKIEAGNEKMHRFMERNNCLKIQEEANFVTYLGSSKTTPYYSRYRE